MADSGISIKDSELDKFTLSSQVETPILSFEKSVYQAVSREMINFISGMKAMNNLIGQPADKYRKKYKPLDHIKKRFFNFIENDVELEKYVNYYKWLDNSIGEILEQLIPASTFSNTGIENVVESHLLERNKYDHKLPTIEFKDPKIIGQILSINELLYDWGDGHYSAGENTNCLWWKDRAERAKEFTLPEGVDTAREKLRTVLNTNVSGSSYVLRKLTKPYNYSVNFQKTYDIGQDQNANKIKNFYKIINAGHEISVDSENTYLTKQCNDNDALGRKVKYVLKTDTSNTSGYLDGDADLLLPFSFYSSSIGNDFNSFKSNLVISNNHEKQTTLQGPFVADNVGRMPHRNVEPGASERPESYDISIDLSGGKKVLKVKSTTGAKSMVQLGPGGAPFYNISNIKTRLGDSRRIGNYSDEYQIVQTSGRSSNNRFLVENEGAQLTGALETSKGVQGVVDYSVPQRTRRSHIFVNKFNSPGSPESAGSFSKSREASEFSIYSTVNLRNTLVREVYDYLSSERAERHGLRKNSSTQASLHKTYRNANRITSSTGHVDIFDNFFVQHQIPQNDFGYSWISSSAADTVYSFMKKNANVGHQHQYEISGTLKSSQTIQFLTSSERDSSLAFVALNSTTPHREVVDSTNTISFKTTSELNDSLLNSQGPYGWPSWKQIRGTENQIVRNHKKSNTLSVSFRGAAAMPRPFAGTTFDYKDTIEDNLTKTKEREIKNYIEAPVTSKFNPLSISLHTYDQEGMVEFFHPNLRIPSSLPQNALARMWFNDQYFHSLIKQEEERSKRQILPTFNYRLPVQNTITSFANEELIKDIDFKEKPVADNANMQRAVSLLDSANQLPNSELMIRELNYIEAIYPKENNTYTISSRKRTKFNYFGWNSDRSARQLILTGNLNYSNFLISNSTQKSFVTSSAISQEEDYKSCIFNKTEIIDLNSSGSEASLTASRYITSSTWPLDSRKDFYITPVNITSSYFTQGEAFLRKRDQGTRGEGILQNDYSIFPLGYNGLRGMPPFAPVYNRRIPQKYGNNVYLAGEAKWEAADNSAIGPFYDSYEKYIEELKLIGQSYSLIPEYTVSKFVEDIHNSGEFTNSPLRNDFLQLTGAVYHSSSNQVSIGSQFFKTYSTTDFMKYFQPIRKELKDNGLPIEAGRLTLRCQAAMRLLPYRGFYPAERAVQISEIFQRSYLKDGSYSAEYVTNANINKDSANRFLNLRIENSKNQASKSFFAPGVLFNSIKSGVAVDYPIFSSSVENATNYISSNKFTASLASYNDFVDVGEEMCFTGSIINGSSDRGIPRIKGSVSRRVGFEDLLNPELLFNTTIYDNEPHPSASLIYGTSQWSKVLERPTQFGSLNTSETLNKISINFTSTRDAFKSAMAPYKSAINNFTAETVKFFLKDEKLHSLISQPVYPFMENGVTYKMKVFLTNDNTTMYDRHSAFGPPVDEGNVDMTSLTSAQSGVFGFFNYTFSAATSIQSSSHGYLPYVPPFLDPGTRPYVELSFTPKETKNHTIPEILQNLEETYYNLDAPSNPATNTNYKEAMCLSASIDFRSYVKLNSDNYRTTESGAIIPDSNVNKYRWIIQPKWETPILNFKNAAVSALKLSSNAVGQVGGSPWKSRYQTDYYKKIKSSSSSYLTSSTGMWHQKGEIIEEASTDGYRLVIEGGKNDLKNNRGDLARALGFIDQASSYTGQSSSNTVSRKLGTLAEKKKISEAVVAIPYYLTDDCEMKLFRLNEKAIKTALEINSIKKTQNEQNYLNASTAEEATRIQNDYEKFYESPGQTAEESIAYQFRMLDKYILPFHFDFIKNENASPHVQYIFQFKSELTKEDLADIWQNMYPTSGKGIAVAQHSGVSVDPLNTDVEFVSNFLNTENMPGISGRRSNYANPDEFLENEVRWLVFKVKLRAEKLFEDLICSSVSTQKGDVSEINGKRVESRTNFGVSQDNEQAKLVDFGYNWPYDYFSIVELVKLESKVDFYSNIDLGIDFGSVIPPDVGEDAIPQLEAQQLTSEVDSVDFGIPNLQLPPTTLISDAGVIAPPVITAEMITQQIKTSMVVQEALKASGVSASGRTLAATQDTIGTGTESVFVNGIVQSLGADKDYTINGNSITFNYDLDDADSVSVSYIKK